MWNYFKSQSTLAIRRFLKSFWNISYHNSIERLFSKFWKLKKKRWYFTQSWSKGNSREGDHHERGRTWESVHTRGSCLEAGVKEAADEANENEAHGRKPAWRCSGAPGPKADCKLWRHRKQEKHASSSRLKAHIFLVTEKSLFGSSSSLCLVWSSVWAVDTWLEELYLSHFLPNNQMVLFNLFFKKDIKFA